MRSRWPESAVVGPLRQFFTTPRCQVSGSAWGPGPLPGTAPRHRRHTSVSSQQKRRYQAQSNNRAAGAAPASQSLPPHFEPPRFQAHPSNFAQTSNTSHENSYNGQHSYAVLGGGITGLAAAHYIAREFPNSKITIYEASDRLGGWLRSERIEVDGGNVLFEHGPRSLRQSSSSIPGLTTLELIQDLSLQDELLLTPKGSLASRNRFIYYPDHLAPMPAPGDGPIKLISDLLKEQVFEGLPVGLWHEYHQSPRPDDLEDESVADFFQRRLGTPLIGDNIVSAMIHGIYAGDIDQLSMKTLFPKLWYIEGLGQSLTKGYLRTLANRLEIFERRDVFLHRRLYKNYLDASLLDDIARASMYTFREGLAGLSSALEKSLRANPNVTIKFGEKVKGVDADGSTNKVSVTTSRNYPPRKYGKVISTIPSRTLSALTSGALPSLASTHAVTVMVVNLYYSNPSVLPQRGFGYLIPRSLPFDQNPERALGVIFSSDTVEGQDTAPGTKVTVMLGGHYWDGLDCYHDEEEGISMAKSVLKRHLHVNDEPTLARATLQRDCIPQYTVGHNARMKRAHDDLLNKFNGNLLVAGNSYCGVSVHDCIRSAREVVIKMIPEPKITGLDKYTAPTDVPHIYHEKKYQAMFFKFLTDRMSRW